jgi:hypothetical protein
MKLVQEVLPPCLCRSARQCRITACVLVVLFCVIGDALARIS